MQIDETKIGAIHLEPDAADPNQRDLSLNWYSFAREIFCLNAYPNGITFSLHRPETPLALNPPSPVARSSGEHTVDSTRRDQETESKRDRNIVKYHPNQFDLRLRDTRDYQLPTGKYFLYKENYARALEHQLSLLHKQGVLSSSVIFFGVTADPFLAIERKGVVSQTCLEILSRYQPGLLVVQTRSAKILSSLPELKSLAERLVVAISVETPIEKLIARYTPGQPAIGERLFAADRLRSEGIQVHLKASPILPYGDFYRDAWKFGEQLVRHGDFISFGSLATGEAAEEAQLRDLPLARKLVQDQQFRMLRPFAHRCVYYAVQSLAIEKLRLPAPALSKPSQLSLFAAPG